MPETISRLDRVALSVPPHLWFAVSAIFHYLGPSFAVLLFPAVGVLGVAWFRVATAALFFAAATRPVRLVRRADRRGRLLLILLGLCLAVMNTAFYLALERLPMGLVAAMEFLATLILALYGLRSRRNMVAVLLAGAGMYLLIDVKWATEPLGLAFSALNAVLFAVYVVLGHRAAQRGAGSGVGTLGAAMAVAFLVLMPVGFTQALAALSSPLLIMAGIGVGLCSSVIPYVADQMAMSRLPRATFALFLSLLPAIASLMGAIVLAQIPTGRDLAGIALVMAGLFLHRPAEVGGRVRRAPDGADVVPGDSRRSGNRVEK